MAILIVIVAVWIEFCFVLLFTVVVVWGRGSVTVLSCIICIVPIIIAILFQNQMPLVMMVTSVWSEAHRPMKEELRSALAVSGVLFATGDGARLMLR